MRKIKKLKKKLYVAAAALVLAAGASGQLAAAEYSQVADASEQLAAAEVGSYGMLPIYGFDVKDGNYSIEVESSSSMFRIVDAELKVENGEMEATITLSGTGYLKLFMGTGEEAAAADASAYLAYKEDAEGRYTYTVPVEALDKKLNCAAYSRKKEQWYDRVILFNASSLPEDALLVELPDYEAIGKAMQMYALASEEAQEDGKEQAELSYGGGSEEESEASGRQIPVEAMEIDLEDGEYSIGVELIGGSGKASVSSPTILKVENGRAYARLQWSSANYDYMIVGTEKYLNENADGGNSLFEIPIAVMDSEMPVIADTTAMGTPHEVEYFLTFYSESIGSKSQMPQEAAKRVVAIAAVIIVGGGVLNHYVKKKRTS